MYKINPQLKIEDFVFPYGKLNSNNDWVKLVGIIPWDRLEEQYTRLFVKNGHPAHTVRIAIGSLIIKQILNCSDAWTVRHISLTDGYTRVERLDFEAFNETADFIPAIERYGERNGHYPERVLVDKLYRN